MKSRTIKIVLLIMVLLIGSTLLPPFHSMKVQGASSPYNVPSNVVNRWDEIYGSKRYSMTSGRKIVYDVYSYKYTKGGFRIVNRDFGKGRRAYLNFQGWAILFGYKRHTSSNNETYIVAENVDTGETKIYSTLKLNLSATEDLEYNNQGPGVYNECPADATNRDNQLHCNMRYDGVGFDAYIPLVELFPNAYTPGEWLLYIVKVVDSRIVYTPLILPFSFDSHTYLGGEVSLTSGINASRLTMIGTDVIRRDYPRQTQREFREKYGRTYYFADGKDYIRVDSEESETAIWYGVRTPEDNNQTKWANTAYWDFSGSQATIKFEPEKIPPSLVSSNIARHQYQNGSDYWVQPNNQVTINIRQYDEHSGNKFQYMRLIDPSLNSGQNIATRNRHDFRESATNNGGLIITNPHVTVDSVQRTENTQYGRVNWRVTPKTHGKSYRVEAYFVDMADNETPSYIDTGMRLRVDGVAPNLVSSSISNHDYQSGDTFWVKPNKTLDITVRQYDGHSGNQRQYLRIDGNGLDVRSWHNYQKSASDISPIWTSNHVSIDSANRTENGANYGTIRWKVTPKTHGHTYKIMSYFQDNVGNNTGSSYVDTGKRIAVDGVAPNHVSSSLSGYDYKSGNTYWVKPNTQVTIDIRQYDGHSGNKFQHMRLIDPSLNSGQNIATRNVHDFRRGSTDNQSQITNSHVAVNSAQRTENSNGYGRVQWKVTPKTHGKTYRIETHFTDLVHNQVSAYIDTGMRLAVDGGEPSFQYTEVSNGVRLQFSDEHSGYKRSRYAFTKSSRTPSSSEWSNWTTSNNYIVSQNLNNQWHLHIQAEDNVGNVLTTYVLVGRENEPPVADFSMNPNPTNRLTDVQITSLATDPNEDPLTHRYEYRVAGNSNWINLGSRANFTQRFSHVGKIEVRQTVTDPYGLSDSIIKTLEVVNLPPKADFSIKPNITDRYTKVSIIGNARDPENDKLTYKYEYRLKGTSSWTQLSTKSDTSHTFSRPGTYEIRLTVTDEYGASDSTIKELIITNEPPIADFSISPNPSDRLTPVKFTGKATDPEGDSIIYKYEYRFKGESNWLLLSNNPNPTHTFDRVGVYQVRLTVTDEWGATDSIIKEIEIKNIAPTISLSYSPTILYEGDSVTITMVASDDFDTIDIELFMRKDNGSWTKIYTKSNAEYNRPYTFRINGLNPVKYEFRAVVTDSFNASSEANISFNVIPLLIFGNVYHTEDWKLVHEFLGHPSNVFYSGERFMLEADLTNYPLEYVDVTLIGYDIMDNPVVLTEILSYSSQTTNVVTYKGSMYEEFMSDPRTRLKNGTLYFNFQAKWSNGVVKNDTVPVMIIDDTYKAYKLHRTN